MRLSRNDLCWCGSNIKYKFCHSKSDEKLEFLNREGYPVPDKSLIRTPTEIEGIRKSGVITKYILDYLEEMIVPGMNTEEINQIVHKITIDRGGIPAPLGYNGFSKSCCTSINEVICHGIPNENMILKDGDIINVDITTILNEFYSDSSRMYLVGNVSEERKKLVQVAKDCLKLGMEAVSPFQPINVIGEAVEPYADSFGFSVVGDLGGHGVGIKFHDEPHIHHFITEEKGMIMMPGMVFTIEPMINEGDFNTKILSDNWTVITVDGGYSAQWEHTIAVTETGYEILT